MRNIDLPIYQRKNNFEEEETKLKILKKKFSLLGLIWGLLGVLLGRVVILEGMMPFGISYFTFFLYHQDRSFSNLRRIFLVLLGVSCGYLTQLGWPGIRYLLPGIFMLVFHHYFKRLNIGLYALITGSVFLLLHLPYFHFNLISLDLITLGSEGVILILTILLISNQFPELLSKLEYEKTTVKLFLLGGVSLGLGSTFFSEEMLLGVNFVRILGGYIILLVSAAAGPTFGTTAGVLTGLAYNLTHLGDIPLVGNYALGGLIAGSLYKKNKLLVGIGFLISNLTYGVFIAQAGELIFLIKEGIGAGIILIFTPSNVIDAVQEIIKGQERGEELESRKFQSFITQRVNQFSEIFHELSTAFSEVLPEDQEDEIDNLGTFLELLTDKVCKKCELYESCWQQSFYETYKSFFNILALAENRGEVTIKQIERKMKVSCPHQVNLATAVNQFVKMYELNNYWQSRLQDNELILLNQLSGMSQVVDNLAEELTIDVKAESEIERKVHSILEREGYKVRKVLATNYNDEELELTVRKKSCAGEHECVKKLVPFLNRKLNYNFELVWSECGAELEEKNCICRFAPGSEYQIQTGVATASLKEGISGDNYTYFNQKDGKFIAILSDGMGVGSSACQESESAVRLLEKMLQAGLDYDIALQTVNSILGLRSQKDNFATIDLLQVDQLTGKAEFIKVGSATSFIKRGSEVSMVKSTTLPVGILNQIELEPTSLQLEDKDIIILVTDGILDSRRKLTIKEEWVLQILRNNLIEDPQSLAQYILEKAVQNNNVEDDMTALVIRIDRC